MLGQLPGLVSLASRSHEPLARCQTPERPQCRPMTDKRKLPPWLIGLLIAVVAFVIGALVVATLGYGDDPVIDPGASGLLRVSIGL